jgi:hypothetical protein
LYRSSALVAGDKCPTELLHLPAQVIGRRIKALALTAIVSCFVATASTARSERKVKTPYYSLALTPDGTMIESLSMDSPDRFQIYENGAATAAFAYYIIAALYKLGRIEDGDRVLYPMLKSYGFGGF